MSVRIKGRGDITVVDVADEQGAWREIVSYVVRHISKAQGFFRDERLALAIGDRRITAADLQMIDEALKGQNIAVVALHTSNAASYQLATQLGLETVWEGREPPPVMNQTERGLAGAPSSFSFLSSQFDRRHTLGASEERNPLVADGRRPPIAEQRQHAAGYPQSAAPRQEASESAARWGNDVTEEPPQADKDFPGPESAPPEDEQAAVTPWGDDSAEESDSPPYVYRGTLRSGQSCTHTGTVVVLGDVNPGAQVISGGDVLVWGRLRGIVHAGAKGDARAIVAALDFEPVQLRIAGYIAMTPKGASNNPGYWFWKRESSGKPEVARVIDKQIFVDPWDA